MWLAIHVSPDLGYLIGVFSWFGNNPRSKYIKLLKHIIWYVFETLDLGVKSDRKTDMPNDVAGYKKSDFA